jgi:hypothetical protein
MQSSHSLDGVAVTFDDPHAVADAGLILPATLAQHLGLRELFDEHVDLGDAPGHANVGHKAMTLLHSALADGDSIDDCDALRAGSTQAVLGHAVAAPSTLGTFLRSFTWGHARQLDKVSGLLLGRAFAAGAGPGDQPVTIAMDSCPVSPGPTAWPRRAEPLHLQPRPGLPPAVRGDRQHRRRRALPPAGRQRQLRARDGRLPHRDLQPPAGRRCDWPDHPAGRLGLLLRGGGRRLSQGRGALIEHAQAEQGPAQSHLQDPRGCLGPQPVLPRRADVAETTYRPFGKKAPLVRLIVQRVKPTPGSQLACWSTGPSTPS